MSSGLYVFCAYLNCCDFIWGLLECVIETTVVLMCLPFVPFICVADALFPTKDKQKYMKIASSKDMPKIGMPKELRV